MSAGVLTASAPLRADIAGGTLDLWPLYLLQPGSSTVNVAIRIMARASYRGGGQRWDLRAGDHGARRRIAPRRIDRAWERTRDGDPFALVLRLLDHLGPLPPGRLTTSIEGPSAAGIGGSSALLIALYALLQRVAGQRLMRQGVAPIARDLEAGVLGFPTGVQDYYPALHGGILQLTYRAAGVTMRRLPVDPRALEQRLVLAYSGHPHESAPSNWSLYCKRIDRDDSAVVGFRRIAAAATAAATALVHADWRRLGRAMDADWEARKEMHPQLAPPDLRRLEWAARDAGVAGLKCCGAASGGCMLVLLRQPDDRAEVEAALAEAGATLLPVRIARRGVSVRQSRG